MTRATRARLVVAAVVLSVLGAFVVARACRSSRPATQLPAHRVPLGAFTGSDAEGIDALAGFAAWLNAPVTVGHPYLPGHAWEDLEGPDWLLDPWSAWRAGQPDRILVLNVPMVAPNEPPLADEETAEQLRRGAAGEYDHHFRRLAQRLVERGATDTILVVGWEMNGTTYSSRCAPDPEAWKQYWRRIVTAMRAVAGQRFRFDFTPARGIHAVEWPRCYPGDDVVDIIGLDSYDQAPGATFTEFVEQPDGLRAHAEFAAARGKPMSYPEWGLYDHADNPDYVRSMHRWITTHDVAYHTISDYCPHGVWRCSDSPRSSAVYRQLFGVS